MWKNSRRCDFGTFHAEFGTASTELGRVGRRLERLRNTSFRDIWRAANFYRGLEASQEVKNVLLFLGVESSEFFYDSIRFAVRAPVRGDGFE